MNVNRKFTTRNGEVQIWALLCTVKTSLFFRARNGSYGGEASHCLKKCHFALNVDKSTEVELTSLGVGIL